MLGAFHLLQQLSSIMYVFCFALCATSILTGCVSQEIDFSKPVLPEDYQRVIKQGFSTNYLKFKIEDGKTPNYTVTDETIQHIYKHGFRNLRLRARADLYVSPYTGADFKSFLAYLEDVVDKCIAGGVTPIISWIHHDAEARASEEDRQNYLIWWRKVSNRLKYKSYRLAFNLFTELGVDECKDRKSKTCDESLRRNKEKYNDWTKQVVRTIRKTGGNNANRILILASPEKTKLNVMDIDENIYKNDDYMMMEWHNYAAGPNNRRESLRYWVGKGTKEQRLVLKNNIKDAKDFTAVTGLRTYFGAWMPRDNKDGTLNQREVINFAEFFVSELKAAQIPWSLNVLDDYYDTNGGEWIKGRQLKKGQMLNMFEVLEHIRDMM